MSTTEAPPEGARTVLLAQMIAVEKGVKQRAKNRLDGLKRELITRLPQMNGLSRTYRAINEEDPERLPAESVRVQVKAEEILGHVADTMVDLFDVVYTREAGNTVATANLQVGDAVIAEDIPVTYLLFLDKQLDEVLTVLRSLPVLDPAEDWNHDQASGVYRTPTRVTTRAKKIPFPFVKAEATDKHPAQVETQFEDKVVGFWDKVTFSGALPADRVFQLVRRAEALQRAVRSAREQANATQVEQRKIGQRVFDYLLAP